MKGMVRISALAALVVAAAASHAVALLPNNSVITPGAPLPAGPIIASVTQNFIGINALSEVKYTGWVRADVIREASGNLTFAYQIHNNANSVNAITRFTNTDFGGFATDVDYAPGTGFPHSLYADRDPSGAVVGFGFAPAFLGGTGFITPGATTNIHYIRTNAKFYTLGSTSTIDGAIATVVTFAPTAVPEPGSVLAIGSALAALALRRRRK